MLKQVQQDGFVLVIPASEPESIDKIKKISIFDNYATLSLIILFLV